MNLGARPAGFFARQHASASAITRSSCSPAPSAPIRTRPLVPRRHPHVHQFPHQRPRLPQLPRNLQLSLLQQHLHPRHQILLRHAPPRCPICRLPLPARNRHRRNLAPQPRRPQHSTTGAPTPVASTASAHRPRSSVAPPISRTRSTTPDTASPAAPAPHTAPMQTRIVRRMPPPAPPPQSPYDPASAPNPPRIEHPAPPNPCHPLSKTLPSCLTSSSAPAPPIPVRTPPLPLSTNSHIYSCPNHVRPHRPPLLFQKIRVESADIPSPARSPAATPARRAPTLS